MRKALATGPGRILACLGIVLLRPAGAQAQSPTPTLVELAHQVESPVRVDGRLDEAAWRTAVPFELPFETSPRSNAPAPTATQCWLARDADHLFIGCNAADSRPEAIRAQYVDRDQIAAHDRIALYLDTFDDGQRAFVFEVSAVGVQADAVFDQTRTNTDYSWNTLWSSAGRITDEGYTIEAAIPLRSLRFPPGTGGQWRFFVERMWPRTEEVVLRSTRRNDDNSCLLCDTDRLVAPGAAARLANVQVTPAVTAARSDRPATVRGALVPGAVDPDIGADVRWGITSEVALAATINPDFSQIEADAVQLEVNNRFALFFPERRDFFLQDAELFSTPFRVVFTRAIADPSVGAKLTGRSGRYAGGVLYARDEITSLLFPAAVNSNATTLDQPADVFLARGSRSVGASSRVGAVLTHRGGDGYRNSLAGVDAFFRPAPPVEVQFQLLRSETEYPGPVGATFQQPEGAFGGLAAQVDARVTTRDWSMRSKLKTIGAGFRADAGFETQVNARVAELAFTRRVRAEASDWLTRIDLSMGGWHSETQTTELNEHGVWTSLRYLGPWQSTLSVNPFVQDERFLGVTYSRWGLNLGGSIRPNATFGVSVGTFMGAEIDYQNARLADSRGWHVATDFRVGRRLSFDAGASARRLSLSGSLIVRERIAKVLGIYAFSDRAFLRVLAQLRDTRRDPSLFRTTVDARAQRVESQAVLTYRLNGQTAGFLGFSTLAGDSRPEGTRLQLTRQNQSFFVKFAYAWRP